MSVETPKHLLDAAFAVAANAYAPYSNFSVGAAAETEDGSVYVGANLENASYGLSLCAEVGAMQAASAAGQFDKIVRIAVVGGDLPITPCGRCRQILAEASRVGIRDIEVWCANFDLTMIECYKISELLPFTFRLDS